MTVRCFNTADDLFKAIAEDKSAADASTEDWQLRMKPGDFAWCDYRQWDLTLYYEIIELKLEEGDDSLGPQLPLDPRLQPGLPRGRARQRSRRDAWRHALERDLRGRAHDGMASRHLPPMISAEDFIDNAYQHGHARGTLAEAAALCKAYCRADLLHKRALIGDLITMTDRYARECEAWCEGADELHRDLTRSANLAQAKEPVIGHAIHD
jgi:hypothetical protein